MYAPLPATIPLVLAPASPLPPDFDASAHTWAKLLADTDRPRRRLTVPHVAPAALGLPQLVSTGVSGRWGSSQHGQAQAPPWVLARSTRRSKEERKRDMAEQRAWEELGVAGLPRDERQALEWEQVKRDWRAKRDSARNTVEVEAKAERRMSGARKSTGTLSGHFASSKATVSARPAASKKRPPSSPPSTQVPSPPPAPLPVSSSDKAAAATRKSRPSGSTSFPSLSSINSAGREVGSPAPRRVASAQSLARDAAEGVLSDGDGDEDDEILSERGCTQMLLPDPTPSVPAQSSRAPRPSTTSSSSAKSSTVAANRAAPFSSPGLRPSAPAPAAGITISTPHGGAPAARRATTKQQLPSPAASPRLRTGTRSPTPPHQSLLAPKRPAAPSRAATTQLSSLSVPGGAGAAAVTADKPALHRLSSIARTGSVLSGRSTAGEGEGDEPGWERFLEEDARD
ncbi:Proteophosphoglycan 5 [Rhodotorula diobovata]|uniref:Proteophosphoglycan 5 n=1 Tax=Rhodotorula diobovata TaxID=5288 RepID=A0A5C5FUM9_9BASI|nr:Proteophosphoglycan 5 [Rhodotorula diobovata]